MSAQGNVAPVIIKKKKVSGGDGHHGGAWKVAYADFVTAMMAFFLLMWLLNATTEQQRKGIADYFSPTIPINRISGGGDGDFGGSSVFSEEALPQNGTGATNQRPTEAAQARGEMGVDSDSQAQAQAEAEMKDAMEALEDALSGKSGESTVSQEARRHILTRVTDEGLVIELFDLDHAYLFAPGTDEPTPLLEELAELLASVSTLVENGLAFEGHTRSEPIVVVNNPVWDLSTSRAQRMRLLIQANGIAAERVQRVTGHADREPALENPMAVRNNRLEVILLRSDTAPE